MIMLVSPEVRSTIQSLRCIRGDTRRGILKSRVNLWASKARLVNRWGCTVGNAFRNFKPLSRIHAYPRPSSASA
jgi:hypothetical protein